MPFALFARTLRVGSLELEICLSPTANVFHVVDQLAAWSPYCHDQYRRWCEETADGSALFTEGEQQALTDHARLREERSWGMGLEQTFYTSLGVEEALKAGLQAGHLSAEQAQTERLVLAAFTPRVERLLRQQWPVLEAFAERLAVGTPELALFVTQVSRFVGVETLHAPVYLIANPSENGGGGGFNGGKLTLEVSPVYDAYPTFLHELFHAFLDTAKAILEAAIGGVNGLTLETLNEGIAYALSPGLIHGAGAGNDPLRERAAHDILARKPLGDPYARFTRYGLALRPLLRDALADDAQTLNTFLPRALDAWGVLTELSAALEVGNRDALPRPERTPRQSLFVFGPCWQAVQERRNRHEHFYARHHAAPGYAETLAKAAHGDRVVLLLASDRDEAVPNNYLDLLPCSPALITAQLQQGQCLEATGTARGWNIILLAAPTCDQLTALVRQTALLERDAS